MALDAGMAQRRPKKKVPPEDELRVPPMPRTNETTATQTKKLADITPPQTNTRAFERSSERVPRSTQASSYYADADRSFSGGGRSFSDTAPKSPESELRISSTPQTKATAEIPATTKTYDWDNPTLERSSERASRSTQRSDYYADSDRGFTGGGRSFTDPLFAPYEVLAQTKRPETYTEDNVLQYHDRAVALASLPSLTDEQRKEASEIANLFGRKFTNPFSGKESLYSRVEGGDLFHDWYDTVQDLDYKAHPTLSGLGTGFAKGVGATSIATAVSNGVFDQLEKAGVNTSAGRKSLERMNDDTYVRKNAPIAYAAGEITGTSR